MKPGEGRHAHAEISCQPHGRQEDGAAPQSFSASTPFSVQRRACELVRIDAADARLDAELVLPSPACGLVIFVQASATTHAAPRTHALARALQAKGIGTLLCDLLTRSEDACDITHLVRFDIERLTRRLVGVIDWIQDQPATRDLDLGLFGAHTGAAAALCASLQRPAAVSAIVCRSGRPDLAEAALPRVTTPTLLIVGGWDDVTLQLNHEAMRHLSGERRIEVVPRATSLFDEPGALDEVARLATQWFVGHFYSALIAQPS